MGVEETSELLKKHDFKEEIAEEVNVQADMKGMFANYLPTGYPDPVKRYRLVIESPKLSIEESYYWILGHLKQDWSYPYIDKIVDTFTASEQSAMWAASQTRLGIQQDRASQYLRGISEMIKQLFQLVRELRILDEKLEPRNAWKKNKSADIALKGEYTDLVENRGGQIQPGSIYHLAQQVGYSTLPDLFFNTHVHKLEDIDEEVDKLDFNKNVKLVLKRKMYAFLNWKLKTDKELKVRRTHTLKFMRQHWNTIKMYTNWVKPYLRNIARMQMRSEHTESADIVGAFESSVTEIEFLAHKPPRENTGSHNSCILVNFKFRTRPELSFQQDNYQHRGPIHVGRVEITMRGYAWTKEDIKRYKAYKNDEDMMLLGMVDENIKAAMEALGDDLENYLAESGETEYQDKLKAKEEELKAQAKKSLETESMLDPFISIFKGLWEIGSVLNPFKAFSSKGEDKDVKLGNNKKAAAGDIKFAMYQTYKNYKKSHQMLSW